MTLVFIFVAIAFTAYALYQTIAPLVLSREDQMRAELLDEELAQIEVLVARRQAIVQALRDLTYDLETDKIEKLDYERFKTSCERQAVAVMRKLEAMHGTSLWRERIDQELATLLGEPNTEATEVPSPLAPQREANAPCTGCGASLDVLARFCSQCGTSVLRDAGAETHTAAEPAGKTPAEGQVAPKPMPHAPASIDEATATEVQP